MYDEASLTADEPVKKKKKRTYNRSPVKVTVDGKTFHGLSISRDGEYLILKTDKGTVFINLKSAQRPIEVVGQVGPVNIPVTSGSGAVTGGVAEFKAARNRNLEAMMSMPPGIGEA